jgi:broad specificity phosphatase PhoE
VRHGQSTWNAEGRIQGSSDFSELTTKGMAQAETTRDMVGDKHTCVDKELLILPHDRSSSENGTAARSWFF